MGTVTQRHEISAREAARRLSVDAATIIRWLKAGKMTGWQTPGGHWRIDPSEVERVRRGTMTTAFDTARERVRNTPELAPHEAFILADWPEGDDHWRWVIDAPVEEIASWSRKWRGLRLRSAEVEASTSD